MASLHSMCPSRHRSQSRSLRPSKAAKVRASPEKAAVASAGVGVGADAADVIVMANLAR